MPDSRCLNCETDVSATQRFCAHCGQRTDTTRLTFGDIVRDLMHRFVNVERGPLAFARALLTRPGGVAREYVDGKRRRHYGPFASLVVLVGLTSLAVNLSGYQVLAHDGLAAGPATFLQRHFNLLLLLQLPLLGAVCALLFRSARLTMPEHMVLVAYTLCVRSLLLVSVLPFEYAASASAPKVEYTYAFWGAWYVYFGWAASQFYAGPRAGTWVRGMVVAAIGHALTMLLLTGGGSAIETLLRR